MCRCSRHLWNNLSCWNFAFNSSKRQTQFGRDGRAQMSMSLQDFTPTKRHSEWFHWWIFLARPLLYYQPVFPPFGWNDTAVLVHDKSGRSGHGEIGYEEKTSSTNAMFIMFVCLFTGLVLLWEKKGASPHQASEIRKSKKGTSLGIVTRLWFKGPQAKEVWILWVRLYWNTEALCRVSFTP